MLKLLLKTLFFLSELVICFVAGLWFSRFMWKSDLFEGLEDDLALVFVAGFIAFSISLAIGAKALISRLAAVVAMDMYLFVMSDSLSPLTISAALIASALIVLVPYWFEKRKLERLQKQVASTSGESGNSNNNPS